MSINATAVESTRVQRQSITAQDAQPTTKPAGGTDGQPVEGANANPDPEAARAARQHMNGLGDLIRRTLEQTNPVPGEAKPTDEAHIRKPCGRGGRCRG